MAGCGVCQAGADPVTMLRSAQDDEAEATAGGNAEIQDLCILRLSALGDVCNVVPAVRALQRHTPGVRITWVIGSAEWPLVAGLEGVEFVVYRKTTGVLGMYALAQRLRSARAGRPFDALLQMQPALRASLLAWFLPTRRRIGFDPARGKDGQHWFVSEHLPAHPRAKVCAGFMDFAYYMGVPAPTAWEWRIPIPESEQLAAGQLLAGIGPYLVLNPFTRERRNNWREWENYPGLARIADHVYSHYGLSTVIIGSPSARESAVAAEIAALARSPVRNLVGQTSLKALLAVIEGAELVLTPDSGPMHFAAAVATPVIGLFATSNPERTGPCTDRWLINRYPEAVQRYLGQSVDAVRWGRRVRVRAAMELITEADIVAQIGAVLEARDYATNEATNKATNKAQLNTHNG